MRALSVDDAAALHEAYRDPDAMRYWSSAPHADLAETIAYLSPRAEHADWRGWAITIKGNDRAIGTLAVNDRRPGVAEIGYMIVPSAAGQGYAREAVARLLDLLFREEEHHRIFADVDPDNARSIALLEALGFTREGVLRQEWRTHIGLRDSAIYGLLAGEWGALTPLVTPDLIRGPASSGPRKGAGPRLKSGVTVGPACPPPSPAPGSSASRT